MSHESTFIKPKSPQAQESQSPRRSQAQASETFSDSRRKDPRPRPQLDTSETFESEALETFESDAPIFEILEFRDRGFKFV